MKRMHGAGGACAHSQQKLLEIEPVDSALRTSGLLPPSTLVSTLVSPGDLPSWQTREMGMSCVPCVSGCGS